MIKKCVQDFYVDKVFVGTDGFNKNGFMGNNLMRAEAIRSMAENATRIVILTESAKFTQTGVVSLFPLDAIDSVYTDDAIPPEASQLLHTKSVRLYTVSEDNED